MQFLIQPRNDGTDTGGECSSVKQQPPPLLSVTLERRPCQTERSMRSFLGSSFNCAPVIVLSRQLSSRMQTREIMDHRTTDNKAGYANGIVNGAPR